MSVKDKVVIITGANSGIGLAAAKELARRGAKVSIVCRDRSKGEAAVQEIQRDTNVTAKLHTAELSSFAAVRALASELLAAYPKIDIFINNAGTSLDEKRLSADGVEMTWAANHLGPFLLTNLLLPRLTESKARIINTASSVANSAKLNFEDPERQRSPFSMMDVYGQSKLANVLFTVELSRRLEGTGVTVNCVHPGVVRTGLVKEVKSLGMRLFFKIAGLFFVTPEKGARTLVYLADSDDVASITGGYFADQKQAKIAPLAQDASACTKLWEISAKRVGL